MKKIIFINFNNHCKSHFLDLINQCHYTAIHLSIDNINELTNYLSEHCQKSNYFLFLYNDQKLSIDSIDDSLNELSNLPERIIIYRDALIDLTNFQYPYLYEFFYDPYEKDLFKAKLISIFNRSLHLHKEKLVLRELGILGNLHLDVRKNIYNIDRVVHILVITSPLENAGQNSLFDLTKHNYKLEIDYLPESLILDLPDFPFKFDIIIIDQIQDIHTLIYIYNVLNASDDTFESKIICIFNDSISLNLYADITNLGIDEFCSVSNISQLPDLIKKLIDVRHYEIQMEKLILDSSRKIFIDELTQIFNRHYLMNYLNSFTSVDKIHKKLALIMIDIDKFKHINDTYGHLAGDYVLKEFASILKSNLNNNGIHCVRFGGDEFIILADKNSLMNDEQIVSIINKINLVLKNTLFSFDSNKINFGISFGYCLNEPGKYNSD